MSGIRSLPMIKLLTGLLLLAWPFVIWFGLAHNGLHWLLPLMALLLLLRLRQTRRQAGPLQAVTQLVAVVGIALCVASFMLKTHQLLLFYPVVVNAVMLGFLGVSRWGVMQIGEGVGRVQGPHLPERGVRYTRHVTQIWCGFFIINGGIALFTALYADMSLWTAWNGMIAYLLMGTLMAGEWLLRRQVMKRDRA